MARRDLTNEELRELQGWSKGSAVTPRYRDLIERLVGEVHELRDREANTRQMLALEGEY